MREAHGFGRRRWPELGRCTAETGDVHNLLERKHGSDGVYKVPMFLKVGKSSLRMVVKCNTLAQRTTRMARRSNEISRAQVEKKREVSAGYS